MTPALTAIICTHNPRMDYLNLTLAAMRAQQPLSGDRTWELLLIDNASATSLAEMVDLCVHSNARVVREERPGLSHARLRGYREARGDIIVCIDDDNVLETSYLREVLRAFDADERLGAVGGKSIARYEIEPPSWFTGLGISLACRDLGDASIVADWSGSGNSARVYPECAPIGAGMGLRRLAYAAYIEAAREDPHRMALGRRGADLASGEDNDIILSLLAAGWKVAYQPLLRLEHMIPARRLTAEYLEQYAYSSSKTWVQVLGVHGLKPWPAIPAWSVALRKACAYVRSRAWSSVENRIAWRAACGLIEGQATIGVVRQ